MLMSHGARSAGLMGWPKRGPSAALAPAMPNANTSAAADILRIHMAHLALRIDAPAGDGVEVLHGKSLHTGRAARRAALGDERLAGRLHVAGLVGGAALQHHRPAVPVPG